MEENFSDLQKLLRLKKYETPSPEYFEGFLKDFHRRQRQEIVQLPMWRIAWDRLTASFTPGEVPRFAYATACAAVLFVTVLTSRQMVSRGSSDQNLAVVTPVASTSRLETSPVKITLGGKQQRFLNGTGLASVRDMRREQAGLTSEQSRSPRYVLDARPASYEPPVSF